MPPRRPSTAAKPLTSAQTLGNAPSAGAKLPVAVSPADRLISAARAAQLGSPAWRSLRLWIRHCSRALPRGGPRSRDGRPAAARVESAARRREQFRCDRRRRRRGPAQLSSRGSRTGARVSRGHPLGPRPSPSRRSASRPRRATRAKIEAKSPQGSRLPGPSAAISRDERLRCIRRPRRLSCGAMGEPGRLVAQHTAAPTVG
jgi:hypothetical protein